MFNEDDIKKYGFGKEQSREFYDERFERTRHWSEHYSKSKYYLIWKEIVEIIKFHNKCHLLEIGCGPGQLSNLLFDNGFENYLGLDFSEKAISMAKSRCPSYRYIVGDAFESDVITKYDYDCLITTEFLEHIHKDVEILESIKNDRFVIATVPNFESVAHVRCFDSVQSVVGRYDSYFKSISVKEFALSQGKKIFLMYGYKSKS